MAPPELARDAPIADVVHPLVVGLFPVGGNENDAAGLDGLNGLFGERFGLDEPLGGNQRLDNGGAARAFAEVDLIRLDLDEGSGLFEIGNDALARLEAVEAGISARGGGHDAVLIDDLDLGQVVAAAGFEIVEVVSGGDFDGPGAELRVGHDVENHRDFTVLERKLSGASVKFEIACILGIEWRRRYRPAWFRGG